jgi:hypothetical protein
VTNDEYNTAAANTWVLTRKLDAGAWGLFFIWTGIALLAGIDWGFGLLGVGIITLGGQLARKYFGLTFEGFRVVVGVLFFAGGVWELLSVRIGLVPIVLIIAGAALLASAVRRPGA